MQSRALVLGLSISALLTACGPKGSGPSVPSTSDAQGATGEDQASDTSSPFDATVAQRLAALPSSLQSAVTSCEGGGHFYDLGSQVCTEQAPSSFPCIINDELKARLDPSTISPLETYLADKVSAHRLYACTEDTTQIIMHFYKMEDGVANYKKLNITKKAG